MRIVIYKADTEVPFGTAYNQLGSTDKIIFSNRSEKVTDFNNKSVDALIHLVEPWLPKKSLIGSQEEDTIFYVPFEIKGKFMEILEKLIDGFKKMMGKGKKDSVPTRKQLGLDKGSSSGSFYDEIEIDEVIMIPNELTPSDALQKEINRIVEGNNEIDCIFFANVGKQGSSSILRVSNESSQEDRQFDWRLLERVLGGVESLEATIEGLNRGELDYTLFKFGNNQKGGILCLSIVPNSRPKLWLGFVSATYQGERMFLSFREEFLPEVLKLSLTDMANYYS
jgi:hypothetical protein